MDFKTLHEDWKTLVPGPFTEPEQDSIYQEFLKIKEQGDVHHHHYAKGDNPDDKKKREKDAKTKAKEGEAKAKDDGEAKANGEGEAKANGEGEAKAKEGEAKANGNGEEKKKLDPVGKEDGDIDNDGDQDKADKYLAKKRKAIGKSIKSQKKTKVEKPIKLSGEKEKVQLHKGVAEEGEKTKKDWYVELLKKKEAGRRKADTLKHMKRGWKKEEVEIVEFPHHHRGDKEWMSGKSPKVEKLQKEFLVDLDIANLSWGDDEGYGDVGKYYWDKRDATILHVARNKRIVKKIEGFVKKYRKADTSEVTVVGDVREEVELDEAVRGKLRDLSQELAAYAKKHRSSVDKQYFEKISQIAAAGKMPSAKDIDTDTEPRDFVLGMMAKSFPKEVMNNYKGVSPALDHALRKDPMKQDKSLEQRRNKGGLFYARHGEEVEHEENGIEEAVLVNRDYKYDGKKIHISRKNFSKVHRDFKNPTKGKEMMMTYDNKVGTVLVPVEFTEEVEEASTFTDKVRDDKKKKKRHFAFGGKEDDKRWGKGGYRRGSRSNDEEVESGKGREVNELTSKLLVRAWQKSKVKADDAIKKRVRGDHSIYKSAGEVIKRSKQGSKFYKAAIDKRMKEKKEGVEEESEWAKSKRSDKEMEDKYEKIHQERDKRYKAQRKKQEKKEGVEFDSKGKIKSLGFSFSDKVKKYNKKMQKSKDEMKKYKKEETDVDEMSAIQKTSLNIHNQRVKLGIVKPGTKKTKKKESGVQKAARHAGMSSAERAYLYNDTTVDEMSKKLLYRAAAKAEVQGREPERPGSDTGFGKRDPNIRRKRRAQAVKFVKGISKASEEVNTGNNRLKSLEKEIDKLHGRTKQAKYLKGKDRDQMRDLSRKRDELLKSRSIQGQFEETEIEEGRTVGSSGYDLYHKTFSDAMQHAYDHAKRKGITVDPSEIDSKVATGPKKPSSNKTNRYILGTDKRQKVHIQVANLDNKRYELNMYIEEVQTEEDIKSRISNSPLVNKLYLMNQAKAIAKEREGPDKEHKISAWEDLAKKMGFSRRDYEEFGDNQGMYESIIPQEKGDMATKTRLKLEKVLGNRKKIVEPKESERAGEWGTDKLSDNYKEATPGQGDVKEGNIIVNDRDPYRVFEHMVHYVMGTSIKNIEDYTFYRIDETPHNLRLENKEGAIATITLADVQSFYDDQDMNMEEFVEMISGFGVKELTEKGNSIIGDEGVPAIGKDKTGQGIYTTDPPKTFENIDIYSKYIQSSEERQKKGFVVN